MARVGSIHLHGIDTRTPVDHRFLDGPDGGYHRILIGEECYLHFAGLGDEAETNLLGFLDQMHAIRNAVLQDRADRAEVVQ